MTRPWRIIYWDTETHRFRPALGAPPIVCMTWREPSEPSKIIHVLDPAALPLIRGWLLDPNVKIAGHYIAYDCLVACAQWPELIPLFFAAYEAGRIECTKIRAQLLDIAAGEFRGKMLPGDRWRVHNYGLADLARRFFSKTMDKDTWRKRYSELANTPISQWPEAAVAYPLEDVDIGYDVWAMQEQHAEYIPDQHHQAYNSFVRALVSCWGLRTKPEMVEKLRLETEKDLAEIQSDLVSWGLVRPDGSRDTKATKALMVQVMAQVGRPYRKTKTGGVCLDKDACDASEDGRLQTYAEYGTLKSVLAKDVKALLGGAVYPVHTRFDMVETGRTSSSKPNVQNWRRKEGIRECFVPRKGKVFFQADYPSLELHTLGQVCKWLVGQSALADALNAGADPHLMVAAKILDKPLDWCKAHKKTDEVDNARQTGKVANFGMPGGLGAEKLVLFARKTYQVNLTVEQARGLKRTWLETWPEMRLYLNHVSGMVDVDTKLIPYVVHPVSKRIRGQVTYCAGCNGYFQGLGADAAQAALRAVLKACYVQQPEGTPDRALFGSRIVNFVHDEIIGECDDNEQAHEVATALARVMDREANKYLPDCPFAGTEPQLMRYWSKKAFALTDGKGRLVPWNGENSA